MSKISLKTYLKTKDEQINYDGYGIMTDNKITYKENDVLVTILYFYDKIMLTRKSDDYIIKMNFELHKNTRGVYNITNNDLQIPLQIETTNLQLKSNEILINYLLKIDEETTTKFSFELIYEVIL